MGIKPLDPPGWERFRDGMRELAHRMTFEGKIEELEVICKRHTPKPRSDEDPRPERKSDAWFAEEILRNIRLARRNLERGHASHAAAEAVMIGTLAGSWPPAQEWREKCERNRAAGRKGGGVTSARADELREAVEDEALRIRRRKPYHRSERSQRWLARTIAGRLGESEHTVRGHLRTLDIK